jgi:hypothetical protein
MIVLRPFYFHGEGKYQINRKKTDFAKLSRIRKISFL